MMGSKIRDTRIRMGLTQSEVSKGICDRSLLSRIENDVTYPSIALLLRLCGRLQLSPGDILTENNVGLDDQPVFLDHLKTLCSLGEWRKVIELGKDALRWKSVNTSLFHGQVANEVGRAYHRLGQYGQALVFFERAFEATQHSTPLSVRMDAQHGIATALQDMGLMDDSLRHYESCYSVLTPSEPTLSIRCGYNYGRLLASMGELRRSKMLALDAQLLSFKTSTYPVSGHLESLLGILYADTQDARRAREHFQRAYHFYQFQGDADSAAGVMSRLATL